MASRPSGHGFVAGGLLLVLALAAGYWTAGWWTLVLLGLDPDAADWGLYLRYLRHLDAAAVAPYAGRVVVGGMLGVGLPLLVVAPVLWWLWRPRAAALHGEARFAAGRELSRCGLLADDPHGIVLGRHRGRLLKLGGQQFVVLAAPTRSGKGVGVVIPNLLEFRGSAVVLDIKQENFEKTSGWRRSIGQEVYLFNPFAEDRRTHRWNPLRYVSADPAFRVSDLMAIAAMLYPDAGDDQKFWISQARNAFLALSLYLFDQHDDARATGLPSPVRPTLGAVLRLSVGDGLDARAHLRGLASRPFVGDAARRAFAGLLSQADDTFASILGTLREPLNPWINPVLDAATTDDDFLLTDVRRRPMTIYVGIQPNKLAEARLILNLFFSQMIQQNTRDLPQSDPSLRHPCLLLMDEFTAIGRIDIIASAVAYMAGYNLRLLPVIQSMAQLDAVYGKETARTLLTNHAVQIVFTPREQRDANDYSEMLGTTTVRRKSVSRGRDTTRSEVIEKRALMLPQELKALPARRAILLCEGLGQPAMVDKISYFSDRRYSARLLPPVDVPRIAP